MDEQVQLLDHVSQSTNDRHAKKVPETKLSIEG